MYQQVMFILFTGIGVFVNVLVGVLVFQAVLSWIVAPDNQLYRVLSSITGPLLAPFRTWSNQLVARGFPVDLSPFFAMAALLLVYQLLLWVYRAFILVT